MIDAHDIQLANKLIDLKLLENTINGLTERERIHAGWMYSVITKLPQDPAYKKLGSQIKEEIEAIIAAVE